MNSPSLNNSLNSAFSSSNSSISQIRRASLKKSYSPIRKMVSSRTLTGLFVLLLVSAAAILYIWQRVRALDLLAEVRVLEKVNRSQHDALAKIEADIADLSRVSRITGLGEEKFGLHQVEFKNLYSLRVKEEIAGENGAKELLDAIKRSIAKLPRIEGNEAVAEELFEEGR